MRQRLSVLLVTVSLCAGVEMVPAAQGRQIRRPIIVSEGVDSESERLAIRKSVQLLPRSPDTVAVIDVIEAHPEVRQTLLRLDAFIVKDNSTIYVTRQSELLKGARAGSVLHIHALAAALWHEMAHVDGASEHDARKKEEALWTNFVRDQRIDPVTALRYLSALRNRPEDRIAGPLDNSPSDKIHQFTNR
jgi:hypothetical protein